MIDLISKIEPLDPYHRDQIIKYTKKKNDYYFYRLFLFLEGNNLIFVKHVKYYFDPTWTVRYIDVKRTIWNPFCCQEKKIMTEFVYRFEIFWTDGRRSLSKVISTSFTSKIKSQSPEKFKLL